MSSGLIVVIILIGLMGIIYLQYTPSATDIQDYTTNLTSSVDESLETIKSQFNETKNLIQETIDKITPDPLTQEAIIQYALDDINRERTKHGLENVTLSPITSGQQHADNLLQLGRLSHWDRDGMKPHMRYTLLGGKGSVAENVAWMTSTGYVEPLDTIKQLNWKMIYDDEDSNWGHRDNLLDSNHNRVSIGVAYDYNNVFLVQDFEDYYFESAEVINDGSIYEMQYTATVNWSPSQIAIYYDPLPSSLTAEQLSKPPYDHGYDVGELVGGILPDNSEFVTGITIKAKTWRIVGNDFYVKFDMKEAFDGHGSGVYTFLIWGSDLYYTTYSIWHE